MAKRGRPKKQQNQPPNQPTNKPISSPEPPGLSSSLDEEIPKIGDLTPTISEAPDEIPKITSSPREAHKIPISSENVLKFRILKLKEQILALNDEKTKLHEEKLTLQKENLTLRKEIFQKENTSFLSEVGLAPGDKVVPDPDGGFYIHRPLLERFSMAVPKKDG